MLDGLSTLVLVHVAITLIAIVAGIPVMTGLLTNTRTPLWGATFWVFTVLTTVTGFMLFAGFTPAFFTGIVATISFALGLYAYYGQGARGSWRWIYVVNAVLSLYLNCFVLVVQSFLKVPSLHALAPNGNEPPFAVAQAVVLMAFLAIGWLSLRRFHPTPALAV